MSTGYKTFLAVCLIAVFSAFSAYGQSYTNSNVGKFVSNTLPATYDTINVPISITIGDMEVRIDTLFHTWDSDVDMWLFTPWGDSIELSTDNGGSGDDYLGTILDQEATTPITAGSAPFTGSFIPEGDLSAFYGMDAAGDWVLRIVDDAGGDDGELQQWGLDFSTGGGGPTWSYGVLYVQDGGNPGGLNTGSDFESVSSWDTLADPSNSANFWSQAGAIPFPFEYFGVPVTHFKASQNMLLTFDTTATLLPNANQNLPTDSLPPMTIAAFWDEFTSSPPTGSNDRIVTKLYGTPPNQQLWIKWFSFEYGNPNTSFQYSAIVLEEGSNKVYLVDMYGSSTGSPALTTTAGVQFDNLNAVQWDSDTLHLAGNGSSNSDNDYYEFYPLLANDYAVNWIAPETNIMVADSTYMVEAEVANLGTDAQTNVPVRLFADGMQIGSDVLVSLAPGDVDTVMFTYTPLAAGDVTLSVTSFLAGDQNPGNDTASEMVAVYPSGTTFMTIMVMSDTVNKPISNSLPPTLDTLTVSGMTGTQIVDMELVIDSLTHTYDSDLDIYLISPYGDSLELSTDNGGSGDNYIGTVFDDQAALSIVSGSAPFTGFFRPEGYPPGFGAWNGMDPDGDWVLMVADDFSGDDGTLHQWSIVLTLAVSAPPPTATLPFVEGFNDTTLQIPMGWMQIDADGGDEVPGADWRVIVDTVSNVFPMEGIGYAANNYQAANAMGMIDEWLITPQILDYQSGMELSFWLNHADGPWDDSVMVLISTTGNDPADFTMIDYLNCPVVWTEYSYNLENYGVNPGDNFYVAFRYYIVDGGSFGNHSNFFGLEEVMIDFPPQLDPPRNLQAVAGDAEVELFWETPMAPGIVEIAYDDGSGEGNLSIGSTAEGDLAVRFTPNVYPSTLLAIRVYFDTTATGMTSIDYTIWDGDVNGPANSLATGPYTINRGMFDDIDVSAAGIQITQNDFFISFFEPVGQTMNLAWDTSSPTAGRGWVNAPGLGLPWQPLGNISPTFDNNLMIRALVLEGVGKDARIVELSSDGSSRPVSLAGLESKMDDGKKIGVTDRSSGAAYLDGVIPDQKVSGKGLVEAGSVSEGYRAPLSKGASLFGVQDLLGYNIYRSTDSLNYSLVASVDSLSLTYLDGSVTNGTTYYYYVTAMYTGGESGPSNVAVATPMGADTAFFDDFEAYTAGMQLVVQNPVDWTTWSNSPGSGEDPYVSSNYAYSGSNSVVIAPNNDLVKTLGMLTSGSWGMTFQMYIPSGKAGYFNTLSFFDGANSEWGMQCFFNVGGMASLDAGGQASATFNYSYDVWNEVTVIVDLDQDSAQFIFNGTVIHAWQWTEGSFGNGGLLMLDANDFYGATPDDEMYFDDYDFDADTLRSLVGIGDDLGSQVPVEFSLEQNYPNPFNPTTTIKYGLKEQVKVSLKIYNILGQVVKTLVSGNQTAGYKQVVWDGTNEFGAKVASGVYIYRIEAGNFVKSQKMILMK